ncbi:hypothetical protein [Vibrio nomapromontoriensis]|uniref:hypothetical protein n=1 Tax=Vibrio nomapromontoriensis TaxID=2910246 RepID=UPI003D1304AF
MKTTFGHLLFVITKDLTMRFLLAAFISISFTLFLFSYSSFSYAKDYGVELEWNTDDPYEILGLLPKQKEKVRALIRSDIIKDIYIRKSNVGENDLDIITLVITANDEDELKDRLADLPLNEANIVKVSSIEYLGEKWLDSELTYDNYGLTFRWKRQVESLEIDRVLGIDLQRVIALNTSGSLTSSYINTQTIEQGFIKPVYNLSVLANDAEHALAYAGQFEAVKLGYANVTVNYLGRKVNLYEKTLK